MLPTKTFQLADKHVCLCVCDFFRTQRLLNCSEAVCVTPLTAKRVAKAVRLPHRKGIGKMIVLNPLAYALPWSGDRWPFVQRFTVTDIYSTVACHDGPVSLVKVGQCAPTDDDCRRGSFVCYIVSQQKDSTVTTRIWLWLEIKLIYWPLCLSFPTAQSFSVIHTFKAVSFLSCEGVLCTWGSCCVRTLILRTHLFPTQGVDKFCGMTHYMLESFPPVVINRQNGYLHRALQCPLC